jgi:hypothetical protein
MAMHLNAAEKENRNNAIHTTMGFILLFLIWLLSSACNTTRIAANHTTVLLIKSMPALDREGDLELAEQAILSNLKMLEGLLEVTPNNSDLLLLTSSSFTRYTFGFVEPRIEIADENYRYDERTALTRRAIDFYTRGKNYGLRALASSGTRLDQALEQNAGNLERELQRLDKKDVPALFWMAYAWGSLIFLQQNDPRQLAELPRVDMIMQRVLQLDQTYFFGGPHMFYGGYFGSRPKGLGGDPGKARSHLSKAIELTDGKFLMARLLLVKFYAVPAQDRHTFKTTLEEIIAAPGDLFPQQTLANNLAKRNAKRWLERIDELFL